MLRMVCIAVGGALGAVCRVAVSTHIAKHTVEIFPIGTIGVNSIGCFFIGFFWGVFQTISVPLYFPLFLLSGFLGALTTFSTYSLETFQLLREGNIPTALFNLAVSNLLGLLMVSVGYIVSRYGAGWVR